MIRVAAAAALLTIAGCSADGWTDGEGQVLPASVVTSFPGAEHCEWESVTFLTVGDDDVSYARDPEGHIVALSHWPDEAPAD